MNGVYNVLDITAMQEGVRKEVWHGFWMKKRSPEKQMEYDTRRLVINDAVRKQLSGLRVFAANIGPSHASLNVLKQQ